eukprot:TCONS_00018041-protein
MSLCWRFSAAILSRLIFVFHSVWSLREILQRIYVDDAVSVKESKYWLLTLILALIVLEGAYTVIIRKGHEYKYFWPSGFIYILIMIPNTCILESFLMDEEIKCTALWEQQNLNPKLQYDGEQTRLCLAAKSKMKDDQKLRAAIEIGMLGALVMGRWLLPRGELTRDQLSALLLAFIGNGADCIEFLNTWNDFPDLRNRQVTDTVLVLYSVSILQFAVVTTKTTDEYKEEITEDDQNLFGEETRTRTDTNGNLKPVRTSASGVPRYIRKLMKQKSKTRASYHATLSSVTLALKDERSNTLSMPTSPQRCSSYEFRTRAFTLESKLMDDNVFEDDHSITRSQIPQIPRRKQGTFLSDAVKSDDQKRSKKIRFRADTNLSTNERESKETARYLQTLAHYGRWDEFSKVLKQAKSSGFNRNSVRFSSTTEQLDDDVNNNETEQTKQNRLADFLQRIPKLKSMNLVDQDFFQTFFLLTTLELPYFIARVVFTVKYNVSSTTMVFYTTKNVVMIIFLLYRLWVKFSADLDSADREETDENGDYSRDLMNVK